VKHCRTEVEISKEANPIMLNLVQEDLTVESARSAKDEESKYNTLNSLILSTFGSIPADPRIPVDEEVLYDKISKIKIGLEEFGTAVMNSTRRLMNFVPCYTSCSSEKYDSIRAGSELDWQGKFISYQASRQELQTTHADRQQARENEGCNFQEAKSLKASMCQSEQKNEELMDKFSEVIDSLKILIKTLPQGFRKKVASDIRSKIFEDYNSRKLLDVLSNGTEKLKLETIYESHAQDEKDESNDSMIKRNLQSSYVFLNLMEESDKKETNEATLSGRLRKGCGRVEEAEKEAANWSEGLECVYQERPMERTEPRERDSSKGYFTFSLNEMSLEGGQKGSSSGWEVRKLELQTDWRGAVGSDVLKERDQAHPLDLPSQPSTPSKFRRRPSLNTSENKNKVSEQTVPLESILAKPEPGPKPLDLFQRRSPAKGGKIAQRHIVETPAMQKGILFNLDKENCGPANQAEGPGWNTQGRSYLKQRR
jgi:hypothetical protein